MIDMIQQARITKGLLDEIVYIKASAWSYPYNKQVEWIYNHLKSEDIHVILRDKGEGVAYLNLVQTSLFINGVNVNCWGIGNVCSVHKGRGHGIKLMQEVNKYLQQNYKIGFLLCRERLIKFYEKVGWYVIDNNKVFVDFDHTDIILMAYNFSDKINRFEYSGSIF